MDPPEPTTTEFECPRECGNRLEYGRFADARRGIRGYSCPECELIWTKGELDRLGVVED